MEYVLSGIFGFLIAVLLGILFLERCTKNTRVREWALEVFFRFLLKPGQDKKDLLVETVYLLSPIRQKYREEMMDNILLPMAEKFFSKPRNKLSPSELSYFLSEVRYYEKKISRLSGRHSEIPKSGSGCGKSYRVKSRAKPDKP